MFDTSENFQEHLKEIISNDFSDFKNEEFEELMFKSDSVEKEVVKIKIGKL